MKNTQHILRLLLPLFLVGPVAAQAQLKAAFNSDVIEGCTPLVVKFSDLSTGNPTSWKWDLGNGVTSTEKNPGIIFIQSGAYSIKLVISDANGVDSIAKSAYINVYGLPVVSLANSASTGCAPLSVQFTDNSKAGSGTISEHIWDFGDGQISKDANPKHVYSFSDTFNVTLSVINSYGCKQSFSYSELIKIPASSNAAFGYNYVNVCQPPAQVNFENQSTSNSPLTCSWDFGDGITSSEAQPSHTYVNSGNYKIRLISQTEFGCTDTAFQSISIGSVKSSFNVVDSVCANQQLYFENTSNPVPASISWTFGDGASSEELNGLHAYTSPGTYTVTMNADFGNCTGTATKIITVTNKPAASFTTTGKLVSCAMPLVVNFKSTSTGAATYKWIFGDGQTSTLQNPTHSFNTAGFYSVSLVAFNTNGCSDTITYKDLVETGPPIITGFVNLPVRECAPKEISFQATINSPVPVVTYLWNFGDGNTSGLAEPKHMYNNVGSYKVTLTVTTAEGCTTTYSLDSAVELGITPLANFIAQPQAVCASLPVSFFDKSSSDVNEWLWFFGDGGTSTISNPSHLYKDTGYFNITLIAKNNNCADTLFIPKYVQIFPPIARFDTTINCSKPFDRMFTDNSIGAQTWSWNFGDGQTSTEKSPTHIYATTGRYGITLKVTNGGCESIKSDSVFIVDEHPDFTYSPMNKAICKYDLITFRGTNYHPELISNLYWNFGDGTSRNTPPYLAGASHVYLGAGTFTPVLVTKDINGCYDTVDKKINIVVYGPTASFTNTEGSCVNNNVIFTDKSTTDGSHPIVSWLWDFGDGKTSQTPGSAQHTYSTSNSYKVKLTLVDSYGCKVFIEKNKAVRITNPIAKFFASDSLICSKKLVYFTNQSSGVSLAYNWRFGDGQNASISKPTHNYPNAGVYTVSLSVTDKYGCKDSMTRPNYITVSNPVASFILNDTIGMCPPLLIEPANTSKNYFSLKWEFGDATNTNVTNPQHYYGIPGTYTLNLIAKGYGNCYDTASKNIVLKGPSGTLNYSTLTGCAPTEIAFSSTAKNVAEFVWDFNNGVVKHSTDTAVTYNYTQYGSYLPKLVLIDAAGCKVSVENKNPIVISGIDAGIKRLIESNTLYCDSALKTFDDSSRVYFDSIKTYKWNFGDNQFSNAVNPSHYYNKTGLYNVSLIVTSKIGCSDSITVPVNVTINKSPVIALEVADSVCESLPVKFKANNLTKENTSTNWEWTFGDGGSDTQQNPVYTYTVGGAYTATLKAIASNGCYAVKNTPVAIFTAPDVNAGIDSALCFGSSIVLHAAGALKYTWRADPSLSCLNCASPIVKADSSGWYYATGQSVAGCKASDSVFVKVYQPFRVSTLENGVLCLGQSMVLHAAGSEYYEWQPSQYLDNPHSAQPVFKPTTATSITYTVVGKDNLNCFTDTASVTMKVYPKPTIQITDKNVVANAGYTIQLKTISSPDVTHWKWTPAASLDSPYTASPFATPKTNTTYTVVATNDGNCSASDEVSVSVLCDGRNIFIPNTFSPNSDGVNDRFYPHGKGIFNVKSLRVFNRWGQVVFEKMNFDANNIAEGWDGTYQGKQQSLDVYVYMMEVICDNGTVNRINGNVTLLR